MYVTVGGLGDVVDVSRLTIQLREATTSTVFVLFQRLRALRGETGGSLWQR
jgi:hypothetical protein